MKKYVYCGDVKEYNNNKNECKLLLLWQKKIIYTNKSKLDVPDLFLQHKKFFIMYNKYPCVCRLEYAYEFI